MAILGIIFVALLIHYSLEARKARRADRRRDALIESFYQREAGRKTHIQQQELASKLFWELMANWKGPIPGPVPKFPPGGLTVIPEKGTEYILPGHRQPVTPDETRALLAKLNADWKAGNLTEDEYLYLADKIWYSDLPI